MVAGVVTPTIFTSNDDTHKHKSTSNDKALTVMIVIIVMMIKIFLPQLLLSLLYMPQSVL